MDGLSVALLLLCYKCKWLFGLQPDGVNLERMGVVRAEIQTVEEIYQLVWTAVASKRPIEAIYDNRLRLFCPHRLGRNRAGEVRVLCYQYGGESKSGLEAFRGQLALHGTREVQASETAGGRLAHRAEPFPSRLVWDRRRHRHRRSSCRRPAERTLRHCCE